MTTIDKHGAHHDPRGLYTAHRRPEAEGPLTPVLTLQTTAPLRRHSLNAANRLAREVARQAMDGDLVLDPPYQRPSVWAVTQQRNLIRSMIEGVPVPAVTINDRRHEYAVVDGKQRIEATVAWFSGELAVPASWFHPDDIEETIDTDDGPYVRFTGLRLIAQRVHAREAFLPVIEANLASIAEEAELYLRLNTSGTDQTAGDLANAAGVAAGGVAPAPNLRCRIAAA